MGERVNRGKVGNRKTRRIRVVRSLECMPDSPNDFSCPVPIRPLRPIRVIRINLQRSWKWNGGVHVHESTVRKHSEIASEPNLSPGLFGLGPSSPIPDPYSPNPSKDRMTFAPADRP
jgi:hypothetical protein